jgi:excisionase family DNA binding protein
MERLTIREAAEALGVTRDAIHKRIRRGSIRHEQGDDGRYYVYVDTSTIGLDMSVDKSSDESKVASLERLIESQQDRISFLERELERRGDDTERLHQIVAALTRTTAELSARLPELEGASMTPTSPQSVGGDAERGKPRPATEERSVTETRREPSPSALTTRLGMSSRAIAIGAIATLLTWFYVFAVRIFDAHSLPGFNFYMDQLPDYVATAPLALVPLLFGLWAGSTKRPSLRWFSSPHRWLRRGGRSALEISIFAAGLPAWAGWGISSIYYLRGSETTPGVLSIGFVYAVGALIWGAAGSLAFMSGAFLGNALGRVGFIGTPKVAPEGEEESGSEEVWTSRQEGRWGLIGGIITASIPAIATVIAALLEGK